MRLSLGDGELEFESLGWYSRVGRFEQETGVRSQVANMDGTSLQAGSTSSEIMHRMCDEALAHLPFFFF